MEQIRQMIRQEIGAFARSGSLRNTSISGGAGLTIRDGGTLRISYPEEQGGGAAVFYGRLRGAIDGTYTGTGMLVLGPDGTNIANFSWDVTDGTQTAHLRDGRNNPIVSNDKPGGWGLSRPWIPVPFAARRWDDFRYSTTSAAFETVADARLHRQHTRVNVGFRTSSDAAGTTGEVRVMIGDTQIGATIPVEFAIDNYFIGTQSVPDGPYMGTMVVEIQARRTGGSGAIRLEPTYLYSRGN